MRTAATSPGNLPTYRRRSPLPRQVSAVAVVLVLVALLGGCGTGSGGRPDTGDRRGPAGAAPAGDPVTVTNCGVTITYQRPPQRAVTMNQHVTEIMLALGLQDRIVGTAYLDDRILPEYRPAYRQIPVLADQYPSYEVLLQANPDFVYGGFSSAFSKQQGRTRDRLREANINTYLNVANCTKGPVTMKHLRHELRTIAAIFNVEKRARALIKEFKAELAENRRALKGIDPVNVFVYDSGRQAPLTVGGDGIANEIIRLAGGRNAFAGLNEHFVRTSQEQLIQRRPEAIVILDYGATSVQQKKQYLLTDPALAHIPALKQRRFAVLPLSSAVAGVRAPHAVTRLARQLHPKQFR